VKHLLGEAGRSFLRAFVASIVILAPGVLAAPNLNQSFALGVAALMASVAAGVKVLQVFIPQLSFTAYVGSSVGPFVDSFARAFIGALVISLPGVLNAPDLSTGRSLGLASIIGAATAGIRALQGLLTKGEGPAPATGI
jgi:hypothetical protein